jgi:hypothetical protein
MPLPPSTPDRSTRRLGWSLAGALALHGGIALWLLRPPGEPPARAERITIDFRTTTPPPPRASPSRSAPPLATRSGRSPPGTSKSEPTRPPPETGPAPAPPRTEAPAAPVPGVQLFQPDALAKSLEGWRHGPGSEGTLDGPGGDSYGEGLEGERRRVGTRVERALGRATAESRVDAGLVDPYFVALGRGFKGVFHPGAADMDLARVLASLQQSGRRFALTGSPLEEPEQRWMAALRGPVAGSVGAGRFDTGQFASLWNEGEFTTAGVFTVLELTQNPDGSLVAVRVLLPSGVPKFDVAARESVARVAPAHPPPEHGLGLGDALIRSTWRFETKLVPQAPVAFQDLAQGAQGGGIAGLGMAARFDEVSGEVSGAVPGQVRLLTRVVLLAVYGGETGPRPE